MAVIASDADRTGHTGYTVSQSDSLVASDQYPSGRCRQVCIIQLNVFNCYVGPDLTG